MGNAALARLPASLDSWLFVSNTTEAHATVSSVTRIDTVF